MITAPGFSNNYKLRGDAMQDDDDEDDDDEDAYAGYRFAELLDAVAGWFWFL